jgi:hypothetical protein
MNNRETDHQMLAMRSASATQARPSARHTIRMASLWAALAEDGGPAAGRRLSPEIERCDDLLIMVPGTDGASRKDRQK